MKFKMNRRKFITYVGCSCCSLVLNSCSTAPITERRQLSLIPETTINRQAAQAYEQFKNKTKLITKGKQLNEIVNIGNRIEKAVAEAAKNM